MMYLVGALGCNAVFAQSYKFSVVCGRDVDWVSFSSFAFSALFLLLAQIRSFEAVVWPAIWLGAVYGLSSGVSQLTFGLLVAGDVGYPGHGPHVVSAVGRGHGEHLS